MVSSESFNHEITSLVGTQCWGFVAGEGTGSTIALDFGGKILRKRTLKNPLLTEVQRNYEAELSLIVFCAWRLESENRIICSSTDSNHNDGPMVEGLNSLINCRITSVNVFPVSYDLILLFNNSMKLTIFCDQTNTEDMMDNYSFFTPQKVYTIEAKSIINIEHRNK